MKWVEYRPKAELPTLRRLFPDGLTVPDNFLGKNVVWIGMMVTDRLVWAVAWFMATLFMFGVWRIGRAEFK